MSFRLVPKSVTLNNRERRNCRYSRLFHGTRVQCRRQTISSVSNLLLILYDHIKTIFAIIQRLFWQNKLITRFDGRRCIYDYVHRLGLA